MTEPDHGLKARLDALRAARMNSSFSNGAYIKAIATAHDANQLITLSDHEAAVKAAGDARDDEILEMIDAKFSGALELRDLARKTKDAQGAIIHGEAVQTLADMRAAIRARAIRARANGGE